VQDSLWIWPRPCLCFCLCLAAVRSAFPARPPNSATPAPLPRWLAAPATLPLLRSGPSHGQPHTPDPPGQPLELHPCGSWYRLLSASGLAWPLAARDQPSGSEPGGQQFELRPSSIWPRLAAQPQPPRLPLPRLPRDHPPGPRSLPRTTPASRRLEPGPLLCSCIGRRRRGRVCLCIGSASLAFRVRHPKPIAGVDRSGLAPVGAQAATPLPPWLASAFA
jgi:hypothetical protein